MQAEHLFIGRHFDEPDDEHHSELAVFSRRRDSAIQRSQDSGALTDWSGSRGSPTRQSCDSLEEPAKYVTVLSVNGGLDLPPQQPPSPPSDRSDDSSDYVTVLSIGKRTDDEQRDESVVLGSGVCLSLAGFVEEVVGIQRKPGQKLGFGLKFDGGVEPDTLVRRLFIQCCAESSPAAGVRCSWGRLVEADEIVEIDGLDIRNNLGRLQVVHKLTDGQEVLTLKIRHYWDEKRRAEMMQQLNAGQRAEAKPTARKGPAAHERAVDVPDELLRQSSHSIARSRSLEPAPAANSDDLPPPVAPPRKRKPKAARSLSSDQVLVERAASVGATVPSKPPRKGHSLSGSFAAEKVATHPAPEPAQVYVNLIADEDRRLLSDAGIESESDANSSVSTVVDARSIVAPFCELAESREFREHQPPKGQQPGGGGGGFSGESLADPVADGVLAVLIQPPETFLDQDPASVSPNSNQDASSDSGASSGGSELHLTESDEELRFFQQMESALETDETGEDCDAILWPVADSGLSSRAAERQDDKPVQQLATLPTDGAERSETPTPDSDLSIGRDAERAPEGKEEKVDRKIVAMTATKANAARPRSRIPQAVSSPSIRSSVHHNQTPPPPPPSLVKNPAAAGANSVRAARVAANNKTPAATSGIATSARGVTSPVRHNAPASRVAPARSASNLTKPINRSPASASVLKSVKPGLAGNQQQQQQQLSKIPRPSSKSGPVAQLARPRHQPSSSSPSSSSLPPRTGVRVASQQPKSPNRAHLTHANKGESASRSDLLTTAR